jgi:uracil-DNA glycosylase family 4
VPFCGDAGRELDQTYLRLAGLDRSDVFVTNCVQCRCERNGVDTKPGAALLASCVLNHLPEEIWMVEPKVIVLAGATACSLVGGIDLELEHGFPRQVKDCAGLGGWSGWVVPMYHPAAALHEKRRSTYYTPLLEDWQRFGLWRKGQWHPPTRRTDINWLLGEDLSFKLILHADEVKLSLLRGQYDYEMLPIDTESDEGRPYSIQYSPRPNGSYMILMENRLAIEEFARVFKGTWGSRAILHNALADLEPLEAAGAAPREYRDTMQELYALGNLPQGLKVAVYRIFGHRMTSYNEVVTPASKSALDNWLAEALVYVSDNWKIETAVQLKTKVRYETKPHPAEAVLRRVMGKLADGSDYDPWRHPQWSKGEVTERLIGREWLADLEKAVGRMPRKSIVHAKLEDQVGYACSDALWTGRLARWLEGERKRIVEREWKVAR